MTEKLNALLFNYLERDYQGYVAYRKLLAESPDWIAATEELANRDFDNFKFFSELPLNPKHAEAESAKALGIVKKELAPYPFFISERHEATQPLAVPHGFMFLGDTKMFLHDFDPVFDIRVKNNAGDWQPWQAIVGQFVVLRIEDRGKYTTPGTITDHDQQQFQNNFQIRYAGFLNVSNFGELRIVGKVADEPIVRTISSSTHFVGFDPEGNAEAPFEERCTDWRHFEEQYNQFDEGGNRI